VPFGALMYEPANNIYVLPNDVIYVFSQPQTFVAFGAAQLGVAGNDVLMEFDYSEIYSPLDLDIGHCHMAVAAPAEGRSITDVMADLPKRKAPGAKKTLGTRGFLAFV